MHSIRHKALKDAEGLGLVAFNAAARVSPPSVPMPTVRTWQAEHYLAFLPRTSGDHYGEALWLLALATGMREGEILAGRWRDLDLVLPNERGGPIWPRNLTRHSNLLQERSGVLRLRFHDLRHTSATIALETGVPVKVVAERLGHASTRFTRDIYLHVSPHMRNEAATLIGQALNRGRPKPAVTKL
ncbi:MAG TPA: site-specific integrase [Chloroflexota bacterium]|nr:site-specific integrase [Chloroflexota bacterium]